jgi:hypothetical protein
MFNVSIGINTATVSAKVRELEHIWELMVPALMAAGFDLESQIMYSLHDYIERSGKFYVTSKVDFDNIMAGVKKDGYEEGVAWAKSHTEALVNEHRELLDENWQAGYDAGLLAGKCNAAKSSSEECEGQSLCGND